MKLEYTLNDSRKIKISSFMKIRPVAAELFHADEQVECELDRQSDAET
jgi:hypothetical protein